MKYNNFFELEEDFWGYINEKQYDEALNLLHNADKLLLKEEYNNSIFELMFLEIKVYYQPNNPGKCIEVVKKAIEAGFSLPLNWRYFDIIRELPDFKTLNEENNKLLNNDKENTKLKYKVYLPKNYDKAEKYPLFICIHGDGFICNIRENSWYWKADALLEKGYIVVYPQSSQIYFHDSFGWLQDPSLSRKELKYCYDQLVKDYSIDESNVLLGGFSGGATTSIDVALHNLIPLKGVIALCPGDYLDTVEVKDAAELAERNTKIVIFEGEYALDPVVQHAIEMFNAGNVNYKYHVIKGLGHEYPKDLSEKTLKAVDFILSK